MIPVILLFLLSPIVLSAQKISSLTVKVKYVRPPLSPLPERIRTYRSEVNIPQVKDDPTYQHLRVPVAGLENASPGDLIVELNFRDFVMTDPQRIEDQVYHVNTASKETGYYYRIEYNFPAELVVTDRQEHAVLLNTVVYPDSAARFVQFGKWTFSEEELANKYSGEADAISRKVFDACVKSVVRQAKEEVNSRFAWTPVVYRQKILVPKSKKSPFYNEFRRAAAKVEKAFEVESYEPGGSSDKLLQEAWEIWEGILSAPSQRLTPSLRLMAAYDLAAIARWMNRFDEAERWAQRAAEAVTPKTPARYRTIVMELPGEINDRRQRYPGVL